MTINHQELFDIRAQKYGEDEQSTRFVTAWMYALRSTLDDLSSPKVGVDTGTTPTGFADDIDLDEKYFTAVVAGTDKYLRDMGEWGSDDKATLAGSYERALRAAHSIYAMQDTTVVTRHQEDA